ncbi:hypothetical protein ACHAXA_008958 [Cyclostephanos tholiformis]|uniref:Uncharacterized protein n=1 Tax=Cyclostephanos tholiformis TaxID=382380 RepID=A0ABD3SBK2_9STRA
MGGVISSSASVTLAYCACASASSLCRACLGTTSPSGTTGRRRSVLLLSASCALSLLFQYYLAPALIGDDDHRRRWWWWNAMGNVSGWVVERVHAGWTSGCESYRRDDAGGDDDDGDAAYARCVGYAGAYRPSCTAFAYFVVASLSSRCDPTMDRRYWPSRYGMYLLSVLCSIFVSNVPWYLGLYLHISRVCAVIFVVIQQVILIDVAYNWNDSWVGECALGVRVLCSFGSFVPLTPRDLSGWEIGRADSADRLEWGTGAKWLRATIAACAVFYLASFVSIWFMYRYFGDCKSNAFIIASTLFGVVGVTILQLSVLEGSLLTSSVVSLYAAYLGYSAVSKNPLGSALGTIVGLMLTALSLAWTGWCYTAEDRLGSTAGASRTRSLGGGNATIGLGGGGFRRGRDPLLDLDDPFLDYVDDDRPPSGLALGPADDDYYYAGDGGDDILPQHPSEVWKLNAVLALVSCWVAMSLTGWGSISGGDTYEEGGVRYHAAANPQVGRVNMVMITMSQWIALSLYAWTLVAPRLFPDRDFS